MTDTRGLSGFRYRNSFKRLEAEGMTDAAVKARDGMWCLSDAEMNTIYSAGQLDTITALAWRLCALVEERKPSPEMVLVAYNLRPLLKRLVRLPAV